MLDEIIKKRRSIRNYLTSLDIPEEKIIKIIESALYAPSAGDLQPWSFIVIRKKEDIEKLAEITGEEWLKSANTVIAVVGNIKLYRNYFQNKAESLFYQSIGACIQNMLLKATELDIASCWVSGFEERSVNEFLEVPEGKTTVALVSLGIKAEEPKKKSVKSLQIAVFYEKYGKKFLGNVKSFSDLFLEKLKLK